MNICVIYINRYMCAHKYMCVHVCVSHLVVSNSFQPMCCSPWNSLGKIIGVGSHSLLQESSRHGDQTQVSCIEGRFFTV